MNSKNPFAIYCLILLSMALLASCSNHSDTTNDTRAANNVSKSSSAPTEDLYVSKVQNSVLDGHPETTISKAFNSAFDNPKWSSHETPKGARIVVFEGAISDRFRRDYAEVAQAPFAIVESVALKSMPDEEKANICHSAWSFLVKDHMAIATALIKKYELVSKYEQLVRERDPKMPEEMFRTILMQDVPARLPIWQLVPEAGLEAVETAKSLYLPKGLPVTVQWTVIADDTIKLDTIHTNALPKPEFGVPSGTTEWQFFEAVYK